MKWRRGWVLLACAATTAIATTQEFEILWQRTGTENVIRYPGPCVFLSDVNFDG